MPWTHVLIFLTALLVAPLSNECKSQEATLAKVPGRLPWYGVLTFVTKTRPPDSQICDKESLV